MVESANTSSTLGIAISVDHLRTVSLDQGGSVVSAATHEIAPGSLAEQIKDICETGNNLGAVGIAVPGMVETKTSRVVDSRVPGLTDLDLKGELRAVASGNISIENDINAAAFAEFRVGAGRGRRNVFYTYLGEGVGSGLVLNGEVWRGSHGFAGELGLVVVDDDGLRLEGAASAPNIVRRTRNRLLQDSTSILSGEGEDEVDLDHIVAAAAEGDDLARLMLERTGFCVGSAIGTAINLLDVGLIVIGGEVTKAGGFFLDAVVQRAKECSAQHSFAQTDIVLSELDESAPAIGAALLAHRS